MTHESKASVFMVTIPLPRTCNLPSGQSENWMSGINSSSRTGLRFCSHVMSISMAFDVQELKRQSEEYRPTFRQSQLIFLGRVDSPYLSNWLFRGATSRSKGDSFLRCTVTCRCAICLVDHEVEGCCTLPCQHRFCFESLQHLGRSSLGKCEKFLDWHRDLCHGMKHVIYIHGMYCQHPSGTNISSEKMGPLPAPKRGTTLISL